MLWIVVRRHAPVMLVTAALSLAVGLGFLALARPGYVAAATIYPAADIEARPPTALGSLALLDASLSPPTAFQKFLAVMRTPRFAAAMDQRLDLARRMFPAEWDPATKSWRPPAGIRAAIAGWIGAATEPFDPLRALMEVFTTKLSITETDKRNAITTIAFAWPERQLANDTLEAALEVARKLLVDQETALMTQEITYLEKQLETVPLAEHRTELARLLADRERQMMLLSAGAYGAEILQPVYTPPTPSRPSIRLTLLLSLAAGLAVGAAIECFRSLGAMPA